MNNNKDGDVIYIAYIASKDFDGNLLEVTKVGEGTITAFADISADVIFNGDVFEYEIFVWDLSKGPYCQKAYVLAE